MKTWKKITSVSVAAMLAVSFTACAPVDQTPLTPEEQAAAYLSSMTQTLEGAKSLTFAYEVIQNSERIGYTEEGDVNSYDSHTYHSQMNFEVTITQSADGMLALHTLSESSESYNRYNAESGQVETEQSFYYQESFHVDGLTYNRSYSSDFGVPYEDFLAAKNAELWEKEAAAEEEIYNLNMIKELLPQVKKILAVKEFEDAKDLIAAEVETFIKDLIENEQFADGKIEIAYDFAPMIEDIYDWLEGIDETTDTLRRLVDDVLKVIDPALTAELVLQELVECSKMTVGEVLTAIDEALAEEGTSLQQIKDQLFATEFADVLLTDMLALDAETIAFMEAFQIDDLKEGEIGGLLVDDLLYEMALNFGLVTEPEEVTEEETGDETEVKEWFLEGFVAQLNAYLDSTMEELGLYGPDVTTMPTFEKFEYKGGVAFNPQQYTFENLYFAVEQNAKYYEWQMKSNEEELYKSSVENDALSLKAAVTFSSSVAQFTLPTDSEIRQEV